VENLKKSIELFQQAIDADPSYALAYAGLADTYNVVAGYPTGISARQAHPLAETAARKALELDDSLAEAHTAMATVLTNEYKWSDAELEFRRSLQLNPNSAQAHYFYTFTCLLATGRVDATLAEFRKALELDPLSPIMNVNYAAGLMAAHRYDESLAQFRKSLELDPNFPPAHFKLSQLYATTGRFADAISEWQKFMPMPGSWGADAHGYGQLVTAAQLAEQKKTGYWPASFIAYGYAVQGDSVKTFQWLNQATADEDDQLPIAIRYPLFDGIRSDPRYLEVMRRINLQP
jgi:Tfp pilus assembly protein PilF